MAFIKSYCVSDHKVCDGVKFGYAVVPSSSSEKKLNTTLALHKAIDFKNNMA